MALMVLKELFPEAGLFPRSAGWILGPGTLPSSAGFCQTNGETEDHNRVGLGSPERTRSLSGVGRMWGKLPSLLALHPPPISEGCTPLFAVCGAGVGRVSARCGRWLLGCGEQRPVVSARSVGGRPGFLIPFVPSTPRLQPADAAVAAAGLRTDTGAKSEPTARPVMERRIYLLLEALTFGVVY